MATHSYDTKLEYDSTGGGVYVELTGIISLNWDATTVTVVVSKPLRASGAVVNKTAGFIDEGAVSFEAEYLNSQWTIWDGFGRSTKTIKITYSDSETNVFTAVREELTRPQAGEDDILRFSGKLAVLAVSDDPE